MPRHGEDGDLFVQALGDGTCELGRFSLPDARSLVLTATEARWLLVAGLPSVVVPPPTPAAAMAARLRPRGEARAAERPAPPPAATAPEPRAPRGAHRVVPGTDDEDAAPAQASLLVDGGPSALPSTDVPEPDRSARA